MEGAPSSKIALPTRPRLPLLCPRSSSPATVKKAAQLQVAASNVREDVTSEHAAVLRDCTLAAPARLTRRATAQLSAESFGSSHRQRRQQQRPRWSAHVARTGEREKSLPNPPLHYYLRMQTYQTPPRRSLAIVGYGRLLLPRPVTHCAAVFTIFTDIYNSVRGLQ
jgi:hypothetical protein